MMRDADFVGWLAEGRERGGGVWLFGHDDGLIFNRPLLDNSSCLSFSPPRRVVLVMASYIW